jgi:arylsulfatase A-like enzyme
MRWFRSRSWPRLCGVLFVLAVPAARARPNILWFVVDDMSAHFSCYGETAVATPHVDRLAASGTRFTGAFVTAPVCSSSRSAMITGCYQTTIGAHHHRSGRGQHRIRLPEGVEPLPARMQRAGYHTCIGSGLPGIDHRGLPVSRDRKGKTDYNFDWDEAIYDSHDWAGRRDGQPFFMQVQLHGGKLRGDSEDSVAALQARAAAVFGAAVSPDEVTLPPHYPPDPVLAHDWAAYLDSVRLTDLQVGLVVDRLRREGLLGNTLIVFLTDHGISHARGKQFLYDEGTHIPFVVSGPGVAAGKVRGDLVEHIDVAALTLAAAGLEIPPWMQGRDILAPDSRPRDFVFAARDRCGEAADRIRSVRTPTHLYIRHFHPERPHLMPNDYKDSKAIVRRLRDRHAAGSLPDLTEQLLFAPVRPAEELYEWRRDRWQTVNLAQDPAQEETRRALAARLDRWLVESRDPGDESPETYDLEVADELAAIRPGSDRHRAFAANAEVYRRWMREGK